ncbi:unnamed protein product [Parnassius mnemosyne]|uniref:PiggyBac transposable element-derived protein domain-containing protein n=1 Tax=Parnassius mnemosyne TaxID=213953 RepID=A0AAV1KIH1_9NEOP
MHHEISETNESTTSPDSSSDDDTPLSDLSASRNRSVIRGSSTRSRRGSRKSTRCRSSRGRRGGSNAPGSSKDVELHERRTWTSSDFPPREILFFRPAYMEVDSNQFNSKQDYFQQYLDDELIALIVVKSNQTFVKNIGRSLNLTESELYIYIGISLAMGAIGLPRLRMYWEKKYRIPIVASSMSRNRFFLLRNSIKFIFDDDIESEQRDKDKVWKIRPLLDTILKTCKLQQKD